MRTRIGDVPDSLISLSLVLILLILVAASFGGQVQANLHADARSDACFEGTLQAAQRPDGAE